MNYLTSLFEIAPYVAPVHNSVKVEEAARKPTELRVGQFYRVSGEIYHAVQVLLGNDVVTRLVSLSIGNRYFDSESVPEDATIIEPGTKITINVGG